MKRFIILSTMFLLLLPLCVFAQKKDILVIESYHAEYPWDASYKEGLEEILSDKYNLLYFEMDTKRLPKSEYENRAEMAWNAYKRINPVLVILGDDNALKYVGPKFAKTTIPVVYLGINANPRAYDIVQHQNITGVLERPMLKRSIAYLKELLTIKKVLVLFDSGTTAQVVFAETFYGKESVSLNGIIAEIKLITFYEEWKKTILKAKEQGYDAILVGLYHTITDDTGTHVDDQEILAWTSENSPLPPFAFWDFSVGPGKTIGGHVLFGKEQGINAGEIALKILSGEKYTKFPKVAEKGRFLFSKSQLKKWGLTLPDDIASKVEYIE